MSQPAPASIVATGTYTRFRADSSIVSAPMRVEALGYDQFRWELDTPDQGAIVTVVCGTTSWHQSSQGTDPVALRQIPGTTFESFPALALSKWINSPSFKLKIVGSESIAGRPVYHVSVTPVLDGNSDPVLEQIYEATHQRDIFVDQQTNLPVRLRFYSHPNDWRVAVPIDVEYSSFQIVSGIAFPTVVTNYFGDTKLSQIQYQSITLNAPVAASDFTGSQP